MTNTRHSGPPFRRCTSLTVIRTSVGLALCLGLSVFVSSSFPSGPSVAAQTSAFPAAADVETYRNTVESVFMEDRGGTTSGYASCVMCHTWQTSVRFSLETPETNSGWTSEQSRRNFDVVTQLINTDDPESSRLLLKPLDPDAGGLPHTGGTYWTSRDDAEYGALLQWIQSLPNEYVPEPGPELDFEFFRACVQPVFQAGREGQIRCSRCHSGGIIGFAPEPQRDGAWSDEEAERAYRLISRVVTPGNAEQSRFLLKPLHPDGGGAYTHNGPRRWQSRDDPEWQMLAGWVRGERRGGSCS